MAIEDLTGYTEVDVGDTRLTVTAPKVDGNDVLGNQDAYVYKDFLADYFDALDIDYEIYIEDPIVDLGFGGIGVADVIGAPGGVFGNWAATDPFAASFHHSNGNVYLRLMKGNDSGEDDYIGSKDTLYYCTLTRVAGNDTVSLLIYDDSGRTNLLDTLNITGFNGVKWRYCYAFAAADSGTTREWDGYTQNINLNEVPIEGVAAAVSVASSVQTASLSGSGNAPLTGTVASVASSVQNSSILGDGDAPLTGAVVSVASSVINSVISHDKQYLTQAPVSVSSSIQTASLSGSGIAGLTASQVDVTTSVPGSTISGSGDAPLTGSVVGVASSVQLSTISGSGNAPLTAAVVPVASSVQAASITGDGSAPLSGAAIVVASSVRQASIVGVGEALLVASPIAAAGSIQQATIVRVLAVLGASPIHVQSSIASAAISGTGIASLFATPIPVITTIQVALMIQLLRDIKRPPPVHDLSKIKSRYTLGRSQIEYTLGDVKKGSYSLGRKG